MKAGAQGLRWMPAIAVIAFACAAFAADPNKVLRVAANDIDTLDPQQYNDNPSFEVLISIFEPLYEWDYLESPPKLSPLTATAPLEITDGGRRWTMLVKPGIFFTDDPAFKGKPRELVAEDYTYSYKRWLDPNGRRGGAPIITDLVVGARALVDAARATGKFDCLLQFEQGGIDYIALRGEIASRLLANGKLKPENVARGVTRHVHPEPYLFSFNFNIADPVIGGMGKDRVALRRAIGLAFDLDTLVKVVYGGQALPANQIVPPGVAGHDPAVTAKPQYDPAAAKALLDRFGYASQDAEGFRKDPDGKPLTITVTLRSGTLSREIQTLWKKNMDAIGLRMDFHVTPFQDAIKEMQQGQFQIIFRGFGGSPSGYPELLQLHSKQPRRINAGLFNLPEYDRAGQQFLRSGTAAEQIAAARRMSDLARTYMPMLPAIFRLENDFVQPWLRGFSAPIFSTYWKYLDIDLDRRK